MNVPQHDLKLGATNFHSDVKPLVHKVARQ
jgi:hypothetical protein